MLGKLRQYLQALLQIRREVEANRLLMGRLLADKARLARSLRQAEFNVFSQFGDDGIIQYLLAHVTVRSRSFVEFGVEDYREANTRFLLFNDGWRGLIMDGSAEHLATVRAEPWYWRYDLTARDAFITVENINQLLTDAGFAGPLGLLSVDIDGNDYWVWRAINAVDPDIVIVEYNAVFGAERAITVPYQPNFVRPKAHYSNLYFGASLPALCDLAAAKGYALVGCTSAGNNAFFVKNSQLGSLRSLTAAEGFVNSAFRESRDQSGQLTLLAGERRAELIRGLPVYNVRTDAVEPF